MAERWVSTKAGAHLAGRRKVNTAPEVLLRQAVHSAGGRFRLHRQIAKGCTPDFVLPSRHIAVFVDGCFWHGCPEHGRKTPWAGPNAELWADKMRRNAERDRRSTQLAQDHGWCVVRVWECQVRRDPDAVARDVMDPQEGDRRDGFPSLSDPVDGVPPAG
ncbi:very short patch repair endonuclease [uncultured Phycicoccus sp.]|uniref:very short patch repair endonuclease n=1 Tax=uncultured Phycicoccus sp. TaxID=661422 RepID=UPI0026131047|nr:very short patch repair endonuclease [uncultured Phycicoccus sp.]